MFTGIDTKQGHPINKQRFIVFLTLLFTLLISTGCGGGGSNEAEECITIRIDEIGLMDNGSFAQGTFTNNCSQQIKSARVEITCFSSSGAVVERHSKLMQIVPPGGQVIFKSVMDAAPDKIKDCSGEILKSSY